MRVVLLHDEVGAGSSADELDVLVQMEAIEAVLRGRGDSCSRLAFSLAFDDISERLRQSAPDLVVNLVESVGGQGRLVHLAPALLDTLRLPYTGCPTDATYTSANKVLAKQLMRSAGIPTPASFSPAQLERGEHVPPGRYIIKSVWEHASRGLDESSVLDARTGRELLTAMQSRSEALAGEGFAEQYIDGREFNLSLIAAKGGRAEVLPAAEIVFEGYGESKPKVVGYRAKWDESSYEYHHTPRRFDIGAGDAALLEELKRLALECWTVFNLRGYARVDFRVDPRGNPFVLEVNSNPCLSPDAGFAAALAQSGIKYGEGIERILAAAGRP
jgi:D-alanine-D-alanine ligase